MDNTQHIATPQPGIDIHILEKLLKPLTEAVASVAGRVERIEARSLSGEGQPASSPLISVCTTQAKGRAKLSAQQLQQQSAAHLTKYFGNSFSQFLK